MMELRQIRSFLSIAETLHFGRTAEMIHLSQPALGTVNTRMSTLEKAMPQAEVWPKDLSAGRQSERSDGVRFGHKR